jgi:site-specific DNA-adenine methylase
MWYRQLQQSYFQLWRPANMGYLGSKAASGAYQAIISQMPPHDTYIETHLGGGAIMLRKPPALRSIGWDIDPVAVEEFCQGNPEFLDNQAERLMIEVGDAVELLLAAPLEQYGRTLLYVDPPLSAGNPHQSSPLPA